MVYSRAASITCTIISAYAVVAVSVVVDKRESRRRSSACIAANKDGTAVIVDSGAVARLVGAVACGA